MAYLHGLNQTSQLLVNYIMPLSTAKYEGCFGYVSRNVHGITPVEYPLTQILQGCRI